MRSITRVVRLGSGFALAVAAACAVAQSVDATRVQTLSGWVQGSVTADGAALRWLGVPYAAPPVGALRWRAPQPAAAWSTTLPADHFGSPCTQIGGPYGPPPAGKNWGVDNLGTFGKPVGSEDCLTLNLWRPSGTETRLPVLVFIHGGSNIVGWSGDPIYDGAHLAAAAHALVVTVNYRLGLMGWFTH
ncbi:MAG TPA: carboxylesterase family protein, partial [Nevskiaceae bacterium]|nr:carboxylesterase family protein [Nevskiaceae bacterium]